MTWRGSAALATLVALCIPVAGQASDGVGDFTARLWAGSLGQKAKLYDFYDLDCGVQDCVGAGVAGQGPRFPKRALRIGAGPEAARIDAHLEGTRPTTVLQYWTEVDEDGRPVGEPAPIEHKLRRKGKHGWAVSFTTPPLEPEAYLDLRARWPDELNDKAFARFGLHIAP